MANNAVHVQRKSKGSRRSRVVGNMIAGQKLGSKETKGADQGGKNEDIYVYGLLMKTEKDGESSHRIITPGDD